MKNIHNYFQKSEQCSYICFEVKMKHCKYTKLYYWFNFYLMIKNIVEIKFIFVIN